MGLRSHPCTPLSPRPPQLRLSCALPDTPSLPKVACNSQTGVTQQHEVIQTSNILRVNCMRNCRAPHTVPPEKSHVIPPGPHSPTAQKPRNINDPISKPETSSRELRAKLQGSTHVRRPEVAAWPTVLAAVPVGGGRARTRTHARLEAVARRAGPAGPGHSHQNHRRRRCGGRRRVRTV